MATAADAQALAALSAYQRTIQGFRSRLTAYITALWSSLGQYSEAEMEQFVRQVVPVVLGAERQVSSTTSAFMAARRSSALGGSRTPAAISQSNVTGAALRNGVDPATVYERPFHLVWRDLAAGKPPEKAIQSGMKRAILTGVTDLQLAKTHTAQQTMATESRVVGYRRVLNGPKNCAMCIVASTQRYHAKELEPIHPGCDCGVEEIYGDSDPGHVIDSKLLADAHDAIAAMFGADAADSAARSADYRKLIVVRQHGELGPVLTVAGHHFTGPEQLNSGLDLGDLPHV